MARTVQQIQSLILAAIAADPILGPKLNGVSQTDLYNLFSYIIATIQNEEEVLYDDLVVEVENIINVLAPATAPNIQNLAFQFQYNSTNPQIIQFSTQSFTPYYPVVNKAYQIITNCSVASTTNGVVSVLVAKGATNSVPQPLVIPELQAFQFYMNQIKPAGIQWFCNSIPADRLYSVFNVTYQGSYAANIGSNLLAAYTNYLNHLSFGGTIKFVDILLALRQVPGVIDLSCTTMVARTNATPFGGGFPMITGTAVIRTEYTCAAGYIIDEDTSGKDFLSNLILTGV